MIRPYPLGSKVKDQAAINRKVTESEEVSEVRNAAKVEKSKYVGNFTNHERDGQGTYYYTNGDKYVGEWKKSSVHGKGTWFLNNGDRWVGELRNNKDWNTTGYDKNGNIIGRIVEGVEQ